MTQESFKTSTHGTDASRQGIPMLPNATDRNPESRKTARQWITDAITHLEERLREVALDPKKTLNSPEGALLGSRIHFLEQIKKRVGNSLAPSNMVSRHDIRNWLDNVASSVDLLGEIKEGIIVDELTIRISLLELKLIEHGLGS